MNFCQKNNIVFLGLFGSYARGEAKMKSDVDLLARFSSRKSLLDMVRLEREFGKIFHRPVDLLTEPELSPYLKDQVLSEIKVIYEQT